MGSATTHRAQASSAAARRPARRAGLWERMREVPARFMRPRIVLVVTVTVLVLFGLLMVFSASSVTALSETGDATYYLTRQAAFAAMGAVLALVVSRVDYRTLCRRVLPILWVGTVVLLVLVRLVGTTSGGATRWISIGGFQFQPSEVAKVVVVLTFANLLDRLVEQRSLSLGRFALGTLVGVFVPLGLILIQPDKGSTLVVGLTLVVMAYLSGLDSRYVVLFLVLAIVIFFGYSVIDDYSRERLLAMIDPWSDYYGNGWQLIQGWYALGSGGLFGVGLGYSRQKYSYLPEAYNDFIFAVIGEELGLVGTLAVVAAFAVLLWAGLTIARNASDVLGRLVASGCTALLVVQFMLNVTGVLGLFPLSGKPIPFLSYGGSSLIVSLMLVGLIVSVSRHSSLPQTEHDLARQALSVEPGGEPDGGPGLSLVEGSSAGEATPRSARGLGQVGAAGEAGEPGAGTGTGGLGEVRPAEPRAGLTVVDGGAAGARGDGRPGGSRTGGRSRTHGSSRPGHGSPREDRGRGREGSRDGRGSRSGRGRDEAPRGRTTRDAGGRTRIDLGPSATERLRGRDDDGPTVR